MRRSRRHRITPRALLCFALIAQLLLPVAQAQLMARDGGLAMLACGAGSADFLASLREQLPPELLRSMAGEAEAEAGMFCPACCAASGDGAAPDAPARVGLIAAAAPLRAPPALTPPRAAAVRLPPARAPPRG